MSLRLDWATHEAAKYACENWHYSKCMPAGKSVKIGVWEFDKFIGVVIFSSGATNEIGSPYGLKQTQICELSRVALNKHTEKVSRIISIALKFLKKSNPNILAVVSYSDMNQGHLGCIYKAGNWLYLGLAKDTGGSLIIHGKQKHGRSVGAKYGTRSLEWLKKYVDKDAHHVKSLGKLKYIMPLDSDMKNKLSLISKPYPKRVGSRDNAASGFQSEEGGAIPTPTLQTT